LAEDRIGGGEVECGVAACPIERKGFEELIYIVVSDRYGTVADRQDAVASCVR